MLSPSSPSTQAICNVSLSLLSSPGFSASLPPIAPGNQERNWCLLTSKAMGGGARWHPRSWTSSEMCNYPPPPRPAKGAGSSCVRAELMQIHEYLCTFNISAHLCFFKDIGRYINAAGGRGNYERQVSMGRGGACLCHSPALGAAQTQSLLHLQAGCSLTE